MANVYQHVCTTKLAPSVDTYAMEHVHVYSPIPSQDDNLHSTSVVLIILVAFKVPPSHGYEYPPEYVKGL